MLHAKYQHDNYNGISFDQQLHVYVHMNSVYTLPELYKTFMIKIY